MNKLDLTVIILTYNEELHIRRCLENVNQIANHVILIDCHSNDKTCEIAEELGAEVIQHDWPGNQAEQFNWALNNIEIRTEWVLRIDADEYLMPELVEELREKLPMLPEDVTGVEFKRRHIFMGRWVKHGIYPVILLRMFRKECGRYDNRLMDEHIILSRGKSILFDHDFCDHSLINISEYCQKHIGYAQREATSVLDEAYGLSNAANNTEGLGKQAKEKHKKKNSYNKLPLFWRAFVYFLFRYILKGGFLDGKEGFLFAFIQGWWYRTMVDAKILEVKNACGEDKEKIRQYIKEVYKIEIT